MKTKGECKKKRNERRITKKIKQTTENKYKKRG